MQLIKNPFKQLTKFEWGLWMVSLIVVTLSFLLPKEKDVPSLITSLIGVTALIFIAKGMVIGQVLVVVFALLYGFVSWFQHYYGEMITYMGMSAPMAISAIVSWLKHPYKGSDSSEVEVRALSKKGWFFLVLAALGVTVIFYFLLDALNTANLVVSTVSVATSFFASALVFLRSPYYALFYALNDVVLIVLWVFATVGDISALPMVLCFVMFFVNDLYGLWSWRKMAQRQAEKK
jgi:nicotinamide mononucleotide transporter PnuC